MSRKSVGKATVAAAMFVLVNSAAIAGCPEGQTPPQCPMPNGPNICDCGQIPCCIYGTDGAGQSYNLATCCTGNRSCKVVYVGGSGSGGGLVNGSLTVKDYGCLK
jgi:hypothetical protein